MKRFMEKVKKTHGCWLWTAAKINNRDATRAYGYFSYGGKPMLAHRFAYEMFVGKIPTGLVIDHKCKKPSCVNPKHLRAVTQKVNVLSGDSLFAVNARKTACPNGHPYDHFNDGKRCKSCRLETTREWKRRWRLRQGMKPRKKRL